MGLAPAPHPTNAGAARHAPPGRRAAALALLLSALASAAPSGAELQVARHAFATAIEDKEPVGTGSSFPGSVGRLYFFTHLTGAEPPLDVLHVWLYDGREVAIVPIGVEGASWRTWSVQRVRPEERGDWTAEVRAADGTVLFSATCRID